MTPNFIMMSKSINENVVTDSENKEKKIAKPRQKKISKPLTPESPAVISNEDELIEPIEEILESVVSTKGLVTKGESSRLVLGQRVAYPGDYVVHEKYGIGQYIGIRQVNLTPCRDIATMQPAVVVRYSDCEVQWFQRVADRELLFFRAFDGLYSPFSTGDELDTSNDEEDKAAFATSDLGVTREQELSGLMDTKKWKKRLKRAQLVSQRSAVNLVKIMTIRSTIHRTPAQIPANNKEYKEFEKSFKFSPTDDQVEAFDAIQYEMTRSTRPMDKLVCGDVGFGKTEVAMRAMYTAVLSGKQVVLMAPTRTLAYQHLSTLTERMPEVSVMLLRGGGKADAVRVKEAVKSGECQIVVGTHAVIQKSVEFKCLGLVVIDEEQRFGVDHKERLKMVTSGVDVLTLSATPIPRTLYMSLSNMRSLNLLKTPPLGRKEVYTTVGLWNDVQVQQAILQEISRGGQVFVIVPFIKDSEEMVARIKRLVKNIRCMEANGRHDDLELRIDAFRHKKADVLVATTVIENGIDMPNVNTIIVSSAERFGMAALHQLRGRVGRSPAQAYALFLTNHTVLTPQAENRLMYLKRFTALGSGYELSMRDMEARGTGSIFGEEQSGNCEVGVELQVRIMARAVETLSLDHVLSVTDTRVTLYPDSEVEVFARKHMQPLPLPSAGLDAVSVWEDEISALVISHSFSGLIQDIDEMNRQIALYQAAQTTESLSELEGQWKEIFNKKKLPPLLEELLSRSSLRQWFRRLGVTSLTRIPATTLSSSSSTTVGTSLTDIAKAHVFALAHSNGELSEVLADPRVTKIPGGMNDWIVCCAGALSKRKWERLQSAIPVRMRDSVFFVPADSKPSSTVATDIGRSPPTGTVSNDNHSLNSTILSEGYIVYKCNEKASASPAVLINDLLLLSKHLALQVAALFDRAVQECESTRLKDE